MKNSNIAIRLVSAAIFLILGIVFIFKAIPTYAALGNASPSDARDYSDEYFEYIDNNEYYIVDMKEMNDAESILDYIISIEPELRDGIEIEYELDSFRAAIAGSDRHPEGSHGQCRIKVTFSSQSDNSQLSRIFVVRIEQIKYDVNAEYAHFIEEFKNKFPRDQKISMEVFNTPEGAYQYCLENLPEYSNNIDVELEVYTEDSEGYEPGKFYAAKPGTAKIPNGFRGRASVIATVTDNLTGDFFETWASFIIMPVPYRSSSSGSSLNGGSYIGGGTGRSAVSVQTDNGIITTNPYIYDGKLEDSNNKLRFRKSDGNYASSQWGYINNHWYLFGNDAYALKGWQKVNGYWYYMNADGVMLTGLQNIDDEWYYMNEYGTMLTGWVPINDKWHFFDGNGVMLHDTITPDGYILDSEGEWVA